MNGHPGGAEHSLRMLELSGLAPGCRVLDMGAGAGETVELLRSCGYESVGIDIEPRGINVECGDMLHTGYASGSFDAVISQCAFYVSGDMPGAFRESARVLRSGGILMLSDVVYEPVVPAAEAAGFEILHREDMTDVWREYYIAAIWDGTVDCRCGRGKCGYELLVCRKNKRRPRMDLFDRIMELSRCGYFCSQILAILMLDTLGEENPGLVKAMEGLNGGVGFSGGCCGCMTGGACIISYVTGKGSDTDMDSPEHKGAMAEFTNWFKEEMTVNYGGTDCEDITKGNPARRVELCPGIIADTYQKCMEILSDRGLL